MVKIQVFESTKKYSIIFLGNHVCKEFQKESKEAIIVLF